MELGTSSVLVSSGAWGPSQMVCVSCPGHAHSVWGCIACALVTPLPFFKRGVRDPLPRGPTEGVLGQVEKWSQSQGGQRGLGKWKSKWV